MKNLVYVLLAISLVMVACNPAKRLDHDFDLFQKGLDSAIKPTLLKEAVIKPYDQLSIQIYSASLNQEQAQLFNITNAGSTAGSASLGGYFVDQKGNIEMPLIGKVKATGQTLQSLEDTISSKLSVYVKNPGVIIKFTQFRVNMMGEINSPGMKTFPNGVVTILDAINQSGGLKDEGRRDSILLIREDSGIIKHYVFDLRNASAFQSPAYQLKQNDIVVVKASANKLRMLKQNPNTMRDISIGATIVSLFAVSLSLFSIIRNL